MEMHQMSARTPVFGKNVQVGKNATIWNYVVIGDNTEIGDNVRIGSFCDIGKDVKIGENCLIQCHVTISNGTIIGDNVFLGPKATILNDKHIDGNIQPCKIEDRARIGGGSTILPGVTVGKDALVGAASVVTKDVPPGKLVYGNPAREAS
jgi:UDP-2-acetamido-3-amino-2,3-dideoxy-glucuronate N-acetyltransferase